MIKGTGGFFSSLSSFTSAASTASSSARSSSPSYPTTVKKFNAIPSTLLCACASFTSNPILSTTCIVLDSIPPTSAPQNTNLYSVSSGVFRPAPRTAAVSCSSSYASRENDVPADAFDEFDPPRAILCDASSSSSPATLRAPHESALAPCRSAATAARTSTTHASSIARASRQSHVGNRFASSSRIAASRASRVLARVPSSSSSSSRRVVAPRASSSPRAVAIAPAPRPRAP
mmetsp:Transcript_527/g.2147  ORF Transcript_527/g.2147 Transcript_527/m.2147 type:complete len:232 (+) Transcript_527:1905-2600(+)